MNINILGAGAWGTAMAIHLNRLGHTVTLTCRRMEQALDMATRRENVDYLGGVRLDDNIQIGNEVGPGVFESDVVIFACPSKGLREWCRKVKEEREKAWRLRMVITLCKGLERESCKLPSEVVREELPGVKYGVISGPNFAMEVANGKPAATVIAGGEEDEELLKEIQEGMSSEFFRTYRLYDVVGVELGGCLKNVYAIAVGCCQGLGLGQNAQAALLTRALHELVKIGVSMGGKRETFYGLSGFGDLVLTANGEASRNRTFGYNLGLGKRIEDLLENRKTVVEGYWAAEAFMKICDRNNIDAPILREVYEILHGNKLLKNSIVDLMGRTLKYEVYEY